MGLASDAGGSIRLPCSFAGIYGHKPSNGKIVPIHLIVYLVIINERYLILLYEFIVTYTFLVLFCTFKTVLSGI